MPTKRSPREGLKIKAGEPLRPDPGYPETQGGKRVEKAEPVQKATHLRA